MMLSMSAVSLAADSVSPVEVYTWGYFDYSAKYKYQENNGVNETLQHLTTLQINNAGYLVKPWMFRFSSGLGLTYAANDDNAQIGESSIVNGKLNLDALPKSIFPMTLFVSRQDNHADGELFGRDFQRTSWGFQQRYLPLGKGSYIFEYLKSDWKQLGPQSVDQGFLGDTEEQRWHFGARERWGEHAFHFSSVKDEERRERGESEDTWHNTFKHQLTSRTLSINNLLTYSEEDSQLHGLESNRELTQLSNVIYWRPETKKPLTITSAMLLSDSSQGGGGLDSNNKIANFNGGATYQLNSNTHWVSSLSGNVSDADERRHRVELRTGVNYRSDNTDIIGFDYRWNSKLEGGWQDDTAETAGHIASVALGHNFSRGWRLGSGNANVSFGQYFSGVSDPIADEEFNLNNSLTLEWNRSNGGGMVVARLSLNSNFRQTNNQATESQLVNLQLMSSNQLTRHSRLNANATIQGFRHEGGLGIWEVHTGINITYQHSRVFNLPRLTFLSEFRLISDELSQSLSREEGFQSNFQNRNYWSNRLRYQVGKLEVSFRVDLIEAMGDKVVSGIFSVRRSLGGLR